MHALLPHEGPVESFFNFIQIPLSKLCYAKGLQSYGPSNFEDDPVVWKSNPGRLGGGSTPVKRQNFFQTFNFESF